jgi:hypothetical protein
MKIRQERRVYTNIVCRKINIAAKSCAFFFNAYSIEIQVFSRAGSCDHEQRAFTIRIQWLPPALPDIGHQIIRLNRAGGRYTFLAIKIIILFKAEEPPIAVYNYIAAIEKSSIISTLSIFNNHQKLKSCSIFAFFIHL